MIMMNKTILTLMLGNLLGLGLGTDVNATPIRLMNSDLIKSVQISNPTMADGMYRDDASPVKKKKNMDDTESESETPELHHHNHYGEEHGLRGHKAEHDEEHDD
jgi:hypothetical protein